VGDCTGTKLFVARASMQRSNMVHLPIMSFGEVVISQRGVHDTDVSTGLDLHFAAHPNGDVELVPSCATCRQLFARGIDNPNTFLRDNQPQ